MSEVSIFWTVDFNLNYGTTFGSLLLAIAMRAHVSKMTASDIHFAKEPQLTRDWSYADLMRKLYHAFWPAFVLVIF